MQDQRFRSIIRRVETPNGDDRVHHERHKETALTVTIRSLALAGLFAAAPIGMLAAQEGAETDAPVRIILFIGDGVGTAYWTAALFAADKLAVREFPVVGLVDTRASNSKVTDSAASATAYAAGVRTFNGAIGVAPDSSPVKTVLELAAERGMATGLIATSRITHATPAAFAAHVPNRGLEVEIARQMAEQNITVMLGGGRAYFDGRRRPDGLDLLEQIRQRSAYVETPEELRSLATDTVRALFGLFTPSHMPSAVVPEVRVDHSDPSAKPDSLWVPLRTPTLPEMTRAALEVLNHDGDGFFLMVEGSQPDWRGHENKPLPEVVAETLDFDGAIGVALEYRERHPETLIVVTADHETGGLSLQTDGAGKLVAGYATVAHTATMVPLFAVGPGAEEFGGIIDNWRVGQLLLERVRR
jgi:alkaline phosphatase